MSAPQSEHLELAAMWVLGGLDEADRSAFERHRAPGCPECEAEIVRLSGGAHVLATAAPPVALPPGMRQRILDHVRSKMAAGGPAAAGATDTARVLPLPPRSASRRAAWGWALAAAMLAVSTATLWRAQDTAKQELAATRTARVELERQLAEERSWMALLDSPLVRNVDFAPTPAGEKLLRARVTWDPATRRAVLVFDHLIVPAGQDYELWGIHPSGPRSLGVVRAGDSGRAVVRLPDAGDPATLQAFALSLEKEGGSGDRAAPAGPVVMVAPLAP